MVQRISISKLTGDYIAAVLRGEIIEVTYQDRVDAVLIRRPQTQEEIKELSEQLAELLDIYLPMTTRRGRPKKEKQDAS